VVSAAIQDGVVRASDRGTKSFPREAHEVASDGLQYQLSGAVVHRQSGHDVILSGTGSSATRVATGVGRLDVVDEQSTSLCQSQSTVIGCLAHHLAKQEITMKLNRWEHKPAPSNPIYKISLAEL